MNILVDIILDSGTLKKSLQDFHIAAGNFYIGDIIDDFQITENFPDIFYGVQQTDPVILLLANGDNGIDDTWDEIVATEEIRGKRVLIRREDLSIVGSGKITDYTIGDEVSISVELRNDEIFDTLLPQQLVTAAEFTTTALNIGAPVPICFGHCKNVPLANIQNNLGDDHYDYLIGYGTIESLWIDHNNNRGVKRNGVLVAESEYTFYDGSQGSPYSGYSFIRFVKEQMDFSGGFYILSADVKGLEIGGASAERNFANVIKALIEDTTWGLGDSVNSASFTTAAAALSTIYWMCDGAITEQVKARDILDQLLFSARSSLKRNLSGEWEIAVDGTQSSLASFGENDGYYDNCEIESVGITPSSSAIKKAIIHYDLNDLSYTNIEGTSILEQKEITLTVNTGFGVDQTFELPFVIENTTAEKVLSYIYGRAKYADKKVTFKADSDAKNLYCGNVITITSTLRDLSSVDYKIISISKKLTEYILKCEKYDSQIFDDQSITDPTASTGTYSTHGVQVIDSGTIGGMTITGVLIKTNDGLVGLNSEVTGGTDWRIWAGHATPGSAPFRVDENGAMWATSANIEGTIIITGGSGIASFSDAGALATGDTLDDVPNGASYGRVALTAISAGKIVLTSLGVTGTLPTALSAAKCTDANADQTSANTCNDPWSGHDLDDLANGTYGKVLTTAISAGKIVLTSVGVTGTLPTSLSAAKCTDVNADQTSVNQSATVAALTGLDLDDLANGTSYGRVALTAISAGKIVLTSAGVSGSLPTSLSDAKCTDVNADQTSANVAASVSGQGNLATLNTVNATYIDAGSITLVKCAAETANQMFSNAANRTNIEAWRHASDTTLIDGGDIYADSVTATQIILGRNLQPNSDFSSWDANDDAIYWDANILKGGIPYLKEHHGYFNGTSRKYSSYYIPVRPNTTYVLSAWLRTGADGAARVDAVEYDINKANPTSGDNWTTGNITIATWTRKEIAKRTAATTYFVKVACTADNAGKLGAFDCIQFEQAGPDGSDLVSIAKASEWSSAGVTQIHGGQIVADNLAVITADMGAITAGTITMPSTGWIKGGQTDFATGTGFFLGYSGAAYKFSCGSPTIYIKFDGSVWTLSDGFVHRHNLPLFVAGDLLEIYSDTVEGTPSTTPYKMKDIYIVRKGTLRIKFSINGVNANAHARIYKNGNSVGILRNGTGVWTEYSQDLGGWSPGDHVQLYAWDTSGTNVSIKHFRLYSNKSCVNLVVL